MGRSILTWSLAALLPMLAPCQSVRHLIGKVLLPDGKPAQGAVVNAPNQRKETRTSTSTADGSFQLSLLPDRDYQVRAYFKGMESNRVMWTRFSARKGRGITLKLQPSRRTGKTLVPINVKPARPR